MKGFDTLVKSIIALHKHWQEWVSPEVAGRHKLGDCHPFSSSIIFHFRAERLAANNAEDCKSKFVDQPLWRRLKRLQADLM
jgi:hypothetical protein